MPHQSAKHFAQKLNQCLDDIDAPVNMRDRAVILSRMLDIPKQQAWTLLEGQILPEKEVIETIAQEFDVDVAWLMNEPQKNK